MCQKHISWGYEKEYRLSSGGSFEGKVIDIKNTDYNMEITKIILGENYDLYSKEAKHYLIFNIQINKFVIIILQPLAQNSVLAWHATHFINY